MGGGGWWWVVVGGGGSWWVVVGGGTVYKSPLYALIHLVDVTFSIFFYKN